MQTPQIASDDNRPPIAVVVVGGLDPSGGAGVVRDALTAAAHGARPIVVGTAWTEQGPEVHRVETRDARALCDSLRQALLAKPASVKVGMVPDAASAAAILEGLRNYEGPVVVDPVLASSRGRALYRGRPDELVPLLARATLATPNAVEAAALSGRPVEELADVDAAAAALAARGIASVLIKGGHLAGPAALVTDTLLAQGDLRRLSRERAGGGDVRGTGCALATAIAVRLGRGVPLLPAVEGAASWLARARAAAVDVGGERHLGWAAG
ncbi:MAG TPA: bifunctional hydroxymethylpyrimidine kinase/phosphomethylpyrimidine kinase [Polyangia bacterium]|nr:bifunctional hydroxymethylpyrimidine kinase/phosphomethylpyrimidine kinase [Polyangia bacterium]